MAHVPLFWVIAVGLVLAVGVGLGAALEGTGFIPHGHRGVFSSMPQVDYRAVKVDEIRNSPLVTSRR